jgi:bifunctional non-homologous end joining protein LigD
VQTYTSETEEGRSIDYVLCQNRATLLYLANMGTIAMNPWNSRVSTSDRPDWMVFDLDPGQVTFDVVCQTALAVKAVLDRLGLKSLAKTSGSRGIHVYVPLKPVHPYEQVAEAAERIARQVVDEQPDIATVERAKRSRPTNKVYVDFLQNAHGKSVASVYSVREHAGATVSAPLDWREVKAGRDMAAFNIKTMPQRLEKRGDLFKAVLQGKQELKKAV